MISPANCSPRYSSAGPPCPYCGCSHTFFFAKENFAKENFRMTCESCMREFIVSPIISFSWRTDPIAITPTPTPFSAKALDVAPSKSTEYADFSQRFVASLIDDFICTITGFIMVAVATTVMGSHSDSGVFIVLGLIFSRIIGCIYYASLESSQKQATWGKQLAGIRVTDLYGNRINFGRACVRFCGKFLSWLILFAGHLMMLCSPKRQALHDAVADTLVVQNRASRNANKPNWC